MRWGNGFVVRNSLGDVVGAGIACSRWYICMSVDCAEAMSVRLQWHFLLRLGAVVLLLKVIAVELCGESVTRSVDWRMVLFWGLWLSFACYLKSITKFFSNLLSSTVWCTYSYLLLRSYYPPLIIRDVTNFHNHVVCFIKKIKRQRYNFILLWVS